MAVDVAVFEDKFDRQWTPFVNFADVHYGHETFEGKLFSKALSNAWDERSYVVAGGDLFDCVLKHGVGNAQEQSMDLNTAKQQMYRMLKPFAEEGLLVVMSGNHDDRIYEETNFDFIKDLAMTLNVPYFCYEGVVVLRCGRVTYQVYLQHGKRGCGIRPGASTNAVDDMSRVFHSADVYIHQHNHFYGVERSAVSYCLTNVEPRVVEREIVLVKAGSYQAKPRYAKKTALPPKKLGSIRLRFKKRVGGSGTIEDAKEVEVLM